VAGRHRRGEFREHEKRPLELSSGGRFPLHQIRRIVPPCEGCLHLESGAKALKLVERVLADFFQMRVEIIG
jgi:hypothetical protein